MKRFLIIITLIAGVQAVFAQKSVVSLAGYKTIYSFYENPIEIAIENHTCDEIIAKVSVGSLTGNGCQYIYSIYDTNQTNVIFRIGYIDSLGTHWVDSIRYRIKKGQEPRYAFAWSFNGEIKKERIAFQPYITIFDNPFGMELVASGKEKISSFSIKITRDDSTIYQAANTSRYSLSKKTIYFINDNVQKGDEIIFYQIISIYKNRHKRKLSDLKYIVK